MPRKELGPRLYLDPKRRQWVIRDRTQFIRTGAGENELELAEAALLKYRVAGQQRATGFIYFLTAAHPDYPIKIGYTEKLRNLRIQTLQTGCPYALYFMGRIPGTMAQERDIQETFDHLRLRGEWFRNDPQLQSYIKGVCSSSIEQVA